MFDEIADKMEQKELEREFLRTGLRGDRISIWPRDPSINEIWLTGYIPEKKPEESTDNNKNKRERAGNESRSFLFI